MNNKTLVFYKNEEKHYDEWINVTAFVNVKQIVYVQFLKENQIAIFDKVIHTTDKKAGHLNYKFQLNIGIIKRKSQNADKRSRKKIK